MNVTLMAANGNLYFPPDGRREWHPNERLILVHRYPEGDCDTVPWPLKTAKHHEMLKACLFDAVETGLLRTGDAVYLPDGKRIS